MTPDAPTTPPTAWNDELLQNPHAVADKRTRVQKMFAAIAPSYDLNNRLHSLWMDQRWRRKAVALADLKPLDQVVDVACGTGDLTMKFGEQATRLARVHAHQTSEVHPGPHVTGIDFTYEMLPIARQKTPRQRWTDFGEDGISTSPPIPLARYINGDALSLPLENSSCDVLSIAFGIRNVQDPAAAIKEFFRVLRPAGRLIILEFSLPTNPLLRTLYNFYFRQILPRTATLISGDKTGAYKYLPESVNTFISRESMQDMMRSAGFQDVRAFPLTFGVCVCYRGVKR